jgi:hypothetical protein
MYVGTYLVRPSDRAMYIHTFLHEEWILCRATSYDTLLFVSEGVVQKAF